jgi:hypothetical protein
VRSRPYTIQGWRPTSAANQPNWLASCGPSTENTSNQSSQRFSNSFPRQQKNAADTAAIMPKPMPP